MEAPIAPPLLLTPDQLRNYVFQSFSTILLVELVSNNDGCGGDNLPILVYNLPILVVWPSFLRLIVKDWRCNLVWELLGAYYHYDILPAPVLLNVSSMSKFGISDANTKVVSTKWLCWENSLGLYWLARIVHTCHWAIEFTPGLQTTLSKHDDILKGRGCLNSTPLVHSLYGADVFEFTIKPQNSSFYCWIRFVFNYITTFMITLASFNVLLLFFLNKKWHISQVCQLFQK